MHIRGNIVDALTFHDKVTIEKDYTRNLTEDQRAPSNTRGLQLRETWEASPDRERVLDFQESKPSRFHHVPLDMAEMVRWRRMSADGWDGEEFGGRGRGCGSTGCMKGGAGKFQQHELHDSKSWVPCIHSSRGICLSVEDDVVPSHAAHF